MRKKLKNNDLENVPPDQGFGPFLSFKRNDKAIRGAVMVPWRIFSPEKEMANERITELRLDPRRKFLMSGPSGVMTDGGWCD